MNTRYRYLDTPVGSVWVAWCEEGLVSLGFEKQEKGARVDPDWKLDPDLRCAAIEQLTAYFAGELRAFDLPLVLRGTEFQMSVWRALADIPYGETTTYGELARRVGRPQASRAVGAANGQNKLAIVLPCHRVIGQSGKLTGFAGGLDRKAQLLEFERSVGPA
jgi:methylated-DNA-[protein]-cysteine S-methyltransferase